MKQRYKWLCLLASIQLIYLYFASSELEDLFNLSEEFPKQRPINETKEELEARGYLEALVLGRDF